MLTVSQYQRGLAHYYGCYKGEIDGKNGPGTKKAVKKFQKLRGLVQDGKYGPKTNAALVSVVMQIQAIVGVKQDGVCGPATVAAIKAKTESLGTGTGRHLRPEILGAL
ncbi:MAG: peptidoglycan-binding domain-containing protein [Clostridia bacterium]